MADCLQVTNKRLVLLNPVSFQCGNFVQKYMQQKKLENQPSAVYGQDLVEKEEIEEKDQEDPVIENLQIENTG